MVQNAHLLSKLLADTAENELKFARSFTKIRQNEFGKFGTNTAAQPQQSPKVFTEPSFFQISENVSSQRGMHLRSEECGRLLVLERPLEVPDDAPEVRGRVAVALGHEEEALRGADEVLLVQRILSIPPRFPCKIDACRCSEHTLRCKMNFGENQ